MDNFFSHANLVAGLISFTAYVIYIVSIFRGTMRPSRSSWWILTFVGGLILFSAYSIGARQSIWVQIDYTFGPLVIAILSLFPKYGYGVSLLAIDKFCLIAAFFLLTFWVVFNAPLIAFLGGIVVDCIGLIPTIKKAYSDPGSEDRPAWTIEMLAMIFNAVGISVWFSASSNDWIYAFYMLGVNGLICALLWRPYFKKKASLN